MTREELQEILDKHKRWLNNEYGGEKANLRGVNLRYADLSSTDLRGVNLRYADLRSTDLRSADLRSADLRSTDLRSADLRSADLRGANLKYANLSYANLRGANLRDANLDYSCLPLWCGSLLANMDDRQVKQLLYHTLSIVKHSNNVSETLKEALLTEQNVNIAKEFHRADECNKL